MYEVCCWGSSSFEWDFYEEQKLCLQHGFNRGRYKDRLYEVKGLRTYTFFTYPFVRGITNLYEMMKIGTTEISWSANQSVGEEENSVLDLVLTVFF